MFGDAPHLSDEEILRAADGELSPRKGAAAEVHLASCTACRARLQQIKQVLAEACAVQLGDDRSLLPLDAAHRALFRARLAESSSGQRGALHLLIRWFGSRELQWAVAGAALLLVTIGIWRTQQAAQSRHAENQMAAAWLQPIPDKALTPGATVPVTKADVCRLDGDQETRPIPTPTRQKVFQEYRTPESRAAEYEVDYLITPGLGGADDIRNLWLEPYSSTIWNAHVKDELEDRLHEMVCSGNLDLATAQRDIATDWISAYRKYFHTQNPVSNRSGFGTDHL